MRKVLIFLTTIVSIAVSAQTGKEIPIGAWRAHSNCSRFEDLMIAGNEVFASSPESFVKYNLDDNSAEILSKKDGYSDVGISELGYYPEKNIYMVGYENGNLDLVKDGIIYNISDIKRKPILGSKAINHITFKGNLSYLSTDFGLVTIDLDKKEIKEAGMNIGPKGGTLVVRSSDIKGDTIFIATTTGVFKASLKSNLLDYSNWKRFTKTDGLPTSNLKSLALYNDTVFCLVSTFYNGSNVLVNKDSAGIYKLVGSKWKKVYAIEEPSNTLNVSGGRLLVSTTVVLYLYADGVVDGWWMGGYAHETLFDKNGKCWSASEYGGLISNKEDILKSFQPNGTFAGGTFKLSYGNNEMFNFYGGYYSNTVNYLSGNGFDIYQDNTWKNFSYNKNTIKGLDFVDGAYNSQTGYQYIASYGSGVYEFKDNELKNIFNETNSTLVNLIPGKDYVRTSALAVDSTGKLWVANSIENVNLPLLSAYSNGKWQAYYLNLPADYTKMTTYEMDVDARGNKWMRIRGFTTLMVFNEKNTSLYRFLKIGAGEGGLPAARVLSIAVDKKGEVWVGTEKGIAIMKEDINPFVADFTIPYFDGFPLLMDKEVFAIEVDGANRKWVGTKDGLWLFNQDATKALAFFDEENSPLPSSDIKDIEINQKTGEVFILTSKGLVSYRAAATEGEATVFKNVKVFPNPVKPDFSGTIGISGLAGNADVKITDVYGNLVYETKALGGTAVWNGKDYNGVKAKTGVYLILSSTQNGEEGYVGKIAIIE